MGKATNGDDNKQKKAIRPTSRQRQMIQLLAQGKVNKEIAVMLKTSVRSVEAYRATIMLKFGFQSLADLVLYAVRERIVSTEAESQKARAAKNG